MPATPAQIEANRIRAAKSTGPRTAEGKTASRRNSLKHGLTSRGTVMLPDDEKDRNVKLAAWNRDMCPDGQAQRTLVETAVTAVVQLERARRHENAAIFNRARHAASDCQAQTAADHERNQRLFAAEPSAYAVVLLRSNAAGCHALVDLLEDAHAALSGGEIPGPDLANRLRLVIDPSLLPANSPTVARLLNQLSASPDAAEARGHLISHVDRSIQSLRAQAADWSEIERLDREQAADRALVDTGREGVNLRRYQTSAELAISRSLRDLAKSRVDLSYHERIGAYRPNPTPVDQNGVVFVEGRWAEAPDAWDGDPKTLTLPPKPSLTSMRLDHPALAQMQPFPGPVAYTEGQPVYRRDWLDGAPNIPYPGTAGKPLSNPETYNHPVDRPTAGHPDSHDRALAHKTSTPLESFPARLSPEPPRSPTPPRKARSNTPGIDAFLSRVQPLTEPNPDRPASFPGSSPAAPFRRPTSKELRDAESAEANKVTSS
ncbi:hypothetical protein EP7_001299 [Isosphaeraceae bacterium EP7]